jgi:hypothetical protein
LQLAERRRHLAGVDGDGKEILVEATSRRSMKFSTGGGTPRCVGKNQTDAASCRANDFLIAAGDGFQGRRHQPLGDFFSRPSALPVPE